MDMTRLRLLVALSVAVCVCSLAPAAAHAACGVSQGRALLETPDVQVYAGKGRAVACLRATGRTRIVGPRSSRRATTLIRELVGGRWLSVVRAGTGGTSEPDVHQLIDLRTGRRAQVAERRLRVETAMLPGVLVHALGESGGVVARYTGGRRVVLSRAKDAEGLVATDDRVFWLESNGSQTRSARLTGVPATAPGGDPPALQRIGRCPADAGSTLLLHDRSRVVSESAAGLRACNRFTGKTWTIDVPEARVTRVVADGLAYRTPTAAGLLRFSNSARVELPVAGDAPAAAGGAFLAGATGDGLQLASARRPQAAARTLAPGAASDVAVGAVASSDNPEDDTVVYWIDAEGAARHAVVR